MSWVKETYLVDGTTLYHSDDRLLFKKRIIIPVVVTLQTPFSGFLLFLIVCCNTGARLELESAYFCAVCITLRICS